MTTIVKEKIFRLKRWFVKKYFKDVMDTNSKIYLAYLKEPTKGLTELHNIVKHRLLDELEKQLNNGVTDFHLYDDLFKFYSATPLYDFISMHYELTNYFLETITDFEQAQNVVVDKERLFFLRTMFQISSSTSSKRVSPCLSINSLNAATALINAGGPNINPIRNAGAKVLEIEPM